MTVASKLFVYVVCDVKQWFLCSPCCTLELAAGASLDVEGGNCAGSDKAPQPVKIWHNTYYKHLNAIAVLSGPLE